ncbi:MAG: hypothetical protein UY42_C0018G0012 [Parcubacteria group bacterium GW2011_GWA2_49_16]|nr:MAG: hypothetical protein UY42_C0018G0012 [Parcubacteria group bacterium GW2011_GWA2_49_16]
MCQRAPKKIQSIRELLVAMYVPPDSQTASAKLSRNPMGDMYIAQHSTSIQNNGCAKIELNANIPVGQSVVIAAKEAGYLQEVSGEETLETYFLSSEGKRVHDELCGECDTSETT